MEYSLAHPAQVQALSQTISVHHDDSRHRDNRGSDAVMTQWSQAKTCDLLQPNLSTFLTRFPPPQLPALNHMSS